MPDLLPSRVEDVRGLVHEVSQEPTESEWGITHCGRTFEWGKAALEPEHSQGIHFGVRTDAPMTCMCCAAGVPL